MNSRLLKAIAAMLVMLLPVSVLAEWSYYASGNVLSAYGEWGYTVENPLSITINAPADLQFNGNYKHATISNTDAWTTAGLTVPTILYNGKTYAPSMLGTYTASISAGGATAEVVYTIKTIIDYQSFFHNGITQGTNYDIVPNVGKQVVALNNSENRGVYWDPVENCAVFDGEAYLQINNPLGNVTSGSGLTITMDVWISSDNNGSGKFYRSTGDYVNKSGWQRLFDLSDGHEEDCIYINAGNANNGTAHLMWCLRKGYGNGETAVPNNTGRSYFNQWCTITMVVAPGGYTTLYVNGVLLTHSTSSDISKIVTVLNSIHDFDKCYLGTSIFEAGGGNADGFFIGKIRGFQTAEGALMPYYDGTNYHYLLSYETNGGNPITGTFEVTIPTSLPTPTHPDPTAVFLGWFMDENLTIPVSKGDTLTKNTVLYAKWADSVNYKLPGVFSVSSDKEVYFSKGNLQYQASNNMWRFAEHQYDYVGDANNGNVYVGETKCNNVNISSTYFGWIDLFGWGTSGNSASGTNYQPWSTSNTGTQYGPSISSGEWTAANSDWGVVNAAQLGNGWRVMTNDEWGYLFNTRTTSATINATPNARYAQARINTDDASVYGVILFPDDFDGSATYSGVTWGTINAPSTWNNSATYTACTTAGWIALEKAGCVFLPAAGYRDVLGMAYVGTNSHYWSSTAKENSNAYNLDIDFYTNVVNPQQNYSRHYGFCVRLVSENYFAGSGTADDPFLIHSEADWNYLAAKVNSGINYSGKYFRMTEDISVTTMVGNSESNSFRGTFDGSGHTLTISYNTTSDYTAPFRYIQGATFKNLKVTGSITTTNNLAAGIAGLNTNAVATFEQCATDITINSSSTTEVGWGRVDYHGGLLARTDNVNVNITDCVCGGSVDGSDSPPTITSYGANFVGVAVGCTVTGTRCLSTTSYTNVSVWNPLCHAATAVRSTSVFYYVNGNDVCDGATKVTLSDLENSSYATDLQAGRSTTVWVQYSRTNQPMLKQFTKYTVTYDANGGSGNVPAAQSKQEGDNLTLSNSTLTRSGFAHTGWNTNSDGTGTHYDKGSTYSENADVPLYAEWDFQGSGTVANPYLIPSTAVWNYLADQVAAGNNYSGKFFLQTGDFTITRMVGVAINANDGATSDDQFKTFNGTYDGGGHTLDVNLNVTGERYVGPFHCVSGNTTIKNLIVTGSVTVSGGSVVESTRHPAALIGCSLEGHVRMENCSVSANVSGADYMGGLIGHSWDANVSIRGCVYNGTLTANGTNYTGGFIGWGGDHGNCSYNLTNNLFAGSYSGSGNFHPVGVLYTTDNNQSTVTNTYYTAGLINMTDNDGHSLVKGLSYTGERVYSVTAGTGVTVDAAGDTTATYDVSGLTFYGTNGFDLNGELYGGNGDVVSLKLSGSSNYKASAGTLNGSSNPYSLTMTTANTVIYGAASVTVAPIANSLTYTGYALALVNAGTATGGTMKYLLDNSTWSTSIPTAINVGNYTVYYKVEGDATHADFIPSPNTVEVTISDFQGSGTVVVDGRLPEAFSVSATNSATNTVYFSQGNLQYKANTQTWRFAEHQNDYVGDASLGNVYEGNVKSNNASISDSYNGWIDLFGWGTGSAPTKHSTTDSEYSTFTDWGQNAISNGGNIANRWRTMTKDEWDYLLFQRTTTSNVRFAKATVNDVRGLIILPDSWNTSYHALNNVNMSSVAYTVNTISLSVWVNNLEAHGAVFLPAGGFRMGTGLNHINIDAICWTSTQTSNANAYDVYAYVNPATLQEGTVSFQDHPKSDGFGVRLVCEKYTVLTLASGGNGTAAVSTPLPAGVTDNNDDTYTVHNGTEVTIEATPATDYHFVQWQDGNSDNPRTVTVTEDTTYTATFAIDEYRLDSIRTTWQVKIGNASPINPTPYVTENPTAADTMGYVMIPLGAEFFIIPSTEQKPLVSKLELIKTPPAGAINGLFSVSPTKQIYFSQGNLQATYNGSSWSWAFATNQWDHIGNASGNISINGNGTVSTSNVTVDLFGWVGASNTTWSGELGTTGNAAMHGISKSATYSDYGSGTSDVLKSDWGNTIGSGWRTLTGGPGGEWEYIINTRSSGSTVNGISNARYTLAIINTDGTGVNGIILFPDGITIANSEATSWGTINGNSSWGTKCTSTQWNALEAKGCVFLPAAGIRNSINTTIIESTGDSGYYWSSTAGADYYGSPYAYVFSFGGGSPSMNTGGRVFGRSVRLVHDTN